MPPPSSVVVADDCVRPVVADRGGQRHLLHHVFAEVPGLRLGALVERVH